MFILGWVIKHSWVIEDLPKDKHDLSLGRDDVTAKLGQLVDALVSGDYRDHVASPLDFQQDCFCVWGVDPVGQAWSSAVANHLVQLI